eukprot:s1285_g26.t1
MPEDGGLQGMKPHMPPDSVIFFNSKLVHASMDGTRAPTAVRPLRLGRAVAFAPRERRSEECRVRKEAIYLMGGCTNHWPCNRMEEKKACRFEKLKDGAVLPAPPALAERLRLL